MEPSAHFQNLAGVICQHLAAAHDRLHIAVCWFSHRDIFEVILKKLRGGVSVELILEYDTQNIRPGGLDFKQFIRLGGQLLAYRDAALMHHKFALVDGQLLLTGSFNWTYSSNAENLMAISDERTLAAFYVEFNRLKCLSVPVRKIRPAEIKAFSNFTLFENTHVRLNDLRRKISLGMPVWWVHMGKNPADWPRYFRENALPFDAKGRLEPFWAGYRVWSAERFDAWWRQRPEGSIPAVHDRATRLLARRMQRGDVVLALSAPGLLTGLGIVQSDPLQWSGPEYSTFREVQWLKVLEGAPLPRPVSTSPAGRYRGSALAVLQAVARV